ncbi:molybdate ABC transporter permease subunit [Paenibacillus sp. IB182496]|uniref:Molybdenum transport system permease n=1 Tax=Paenibacillus sabuli TaxID=2772509 RepID=A0A927BVX8_9BACL|nr:molybdate ABC transporter permease subunit [Paenibacillus sabuli]MBD2847843.1 molybdate ABC transporter permease subunit [Paenibacillus sabuli]
MMAQPFDWAAFWEPVLLSLRVALLAGTCTLALGTLAAWGVARRRFRGRVLVETLFMLPLVLPPTVVGFLLLVALGRNSALGRLAEWIFAAPILFSWWAAVIAAVVVAFPLVYQTMKVGFNSVDRHLEDAARSAGAREWQVFRYVTFPLVGRSFAAAFVLGTARALGEFGATLMIAGNIPGHTQTVPTAIYVAVDAGRQEMAWAWTLSIVAISFVMLLLTGRGRAER